MARQVTDWGEINWFDEERGIEAKPLRTGIVTLGAGLHQAKHTHYEEQVIYCLEGSALSVIDGEESILKPGDHCHWAAGVEHEVFCLGDGPFRHLLVSNPYVGELEAKNEGRISRPDVDPNLIYTAVEAVRKQFLGNLHYPFAIFDSFGNLILQGDYFPEYCVSVCDPASNEGCVSCMLQGGPETEKTAGSENEKYEKAAPRFSDKPLSFVCPKGMEVFQEPIIFHGSLLGVIQSGYIRRSGAKSGTPEGVYEYPVSAVAGVRGLLKRIVRSLVNYCEFEQDRIELMEQELRIASQTEASRLLLEDLKVGRSEVTDLKINNHFLFNTLNTFASMALDENAMVLYQSIVDLSKMFRYTLRSRSAMVELSGEIEYVGAYLKLQKLRYGDALSIVTAVDDEAVSARVPFNFLQPVVENAFVHGFGDCSEKRIDLTVGRFGDNVEIWVVNSGKALGARECDAVNKSMRSGTSHGLSMIYQKLSGIYGNSFTFEAARTKGGETCFHFVIPYT